VTPPAPRDLRRLDPPVQRRITSILDRFVADPFAGDIRRLNTIEWRRVSETGACASPSMMSGT
jgi:hypothetical protein